MPFRNLINILKILIKLSLVIGLLLIIAIGGLVAIQEVMTGDTPTTETPTEESNQTTPTGDSNQTTETTKNDSMTNSSEPKSYVFSNRIKIS